MATLMKLKQILLLLGCVALSHSLFGINPEKDTSNTDETTYEEYVDQPDEETMSKAEQRRQRRLERHNKRLNWLTDKVVDEEQPAAGIDFQDPVDKWLWFAIFGLGAAIILGIILSSVGALGWIAALFGIFAVTSFVVWVILKYAD